jgi:hypothetical protein
MMALVSGLELFIKGSKNMGKIQQRFIAGWQENEAFKLSITSVLKALEPCLPSRRGNDGTSPLPKGSA